jgi:glucose-6-phosphate 1-dehydrogenase
MTPAPADALIFFGATGDLAYKTIFACEALLTDAMRGIPTRFARQDYVEEAWRIVDPILDGVTPVYPYEPWTWGPAEADRIGPPPGGWFTPILHK